jgi:hypothetical protein
MNTHKGFINPLWLVVVLVVVIGAGGSAWWATQNKAPVTFENDNYGPEVLPIAASQKPTAASLSLEALQNAEYPSSDAMGLVKFANGYAALEPMKGESQEDYYLKLDPDHIARGDLNNDDQEDAVVILVSRSGGSGTFRYLNVMLNQNGEPQYTAQAYLGDRTTVNNVSISGGLITVDAILWQGGIQMPKQFIFALSGNNLEERSNELNKVDALPKTSQ